MTEAIATRPADLPAFIPYGDARGTENITKDDIIFPALKLAQGTSPQIKRADPKFIKDLREGEFFNTSSQAIYGEGPINLLIVNFLGHRHVEFDPKDRNVVLDGSVPDGDPRTKFTFKEENGKKVRVKPRATKFYDYLVLLLDDGLELATMSLKSTQLKKAVALNTKLKRSKMPCFAHLFKATAMPEQGGQNNWYGWRFDAIGYPTEAQYVAAEKHHQKFSDIKIVPEAEGDETPAEQPQVQDDDIPF